MMSLLRPYDWARADAAPIPPRPRQPARLLVSLLAATAGGVIAALATLAGYVIAETVTGLADLLPDGLGALLAVGVGGTAGVLVWRAIAIKWNRPPASPPRGWGG